jgi:hypothetical protein
MVLNLYATPVGQNFVRIARKSPSGMWDRSRPVRIWLFRDNKRPQNHATQGIPNRTEHFEAILEKLNNSRNKKLTNSNMVGNKNLMIFSPETQGDGHTISNLANYQQFLMKSILPTRSFLATQGLDQKKFRLFDDFIVTRKKNDVNGHTHLYHLGNNRNSAVLLQHILDSNPSNMVIEFHDLWIYDLLNDFGELHGFNDFAEELVRCALGAYGVIKLNSILKQRKDFFTEQDKFEIATIFLNSLHRIQASYFSHGVNGDFESYLEKFCLLKINNLEMPIEYAGKKVGQIVIGASKKIIVSGTASYSKELDTTTKVLIALATSIPELEIDIVGSVSIGIEKQLNGIQMLKSVRKKFKFYPSVATERWEALHKGSNCGLRLGVGKNGEASGVVRDYLAYGLKVVSDEPSLSLIGNPQYFYFDNKIALSENISLLEEFLASEIVTNPQDSDNISNLYRSSLKEMLGI